MNRSISISQPIIKKQEKSAVLNILDSGHIVQGKKVQELESAFQQLCKVKYAIATNNGTSALHTAIHAVGIQPGDEVITTPFTFVATVNSILMTGAIPVFVDIDEQSFNIDPKKIEAAITKKTKAILVVNLYGLPADYTEIMAIAKKHNLVVIEDAAQSINAEYKKKKSGNLADIACFSLYATKNIMSGEGGMITTNKKEYYERARLFRQHGQDDKKRYEYYGLGYNYRMMDLQAAIALAQLSRLELITKKRRANALLYDLGLKNTPGIITPHVNIPSQHAYHQYTIRVTEGCRINRQEMIEKLHKRDINVGIYYPTPLHLVEHISKGRYKKGDFPISEKASQQVLSLPVHPQLTKKDIYYVVKAIKTVT